MKKLVIASVVGFLSVLGLAIDIAAADSLCTNLSQDLSAGTRGSEVLQLQTFLVSQNYPGSGAWMLTGYYGRATTAAVRAFQGQHGLSQTGVADSSTRAAISSHSCNTATVSAAPSPAQFQTSPIPSYGWNWNLYNTNYVSLNLTSLSQNTGFPGTSVTIYGSGFDPSYNTINFGGQTITGVSSNGSSITFTIPVYYAYYGSNYNGTPVSITVSNSRGTSNALTFTVYGGVQSCQYPYVSYSWYGTNPCSINLTPNNYNNPTLSYIDPTSGVVGATVTVYGSGFTPSNNTVHLGVGIITGLLSPDGRSVSFTVPSQLSGYGSQNIGLGAYSVSVTNSYGYTTNPSTFTVTSLGGSGSASISSVNGPGAVNTGNSATWTIVLNNPSGNNATVNVNWGDSAVYTPYAAQSQAVYTGTQTFTFSHTYYNAGTYNITFTVTGSNGVSSNAAASVVVTGGSIVSSAPYISSMMPTYGAVGTYVTIYGSNFSLSNNTVRFGNGAIANISSNGSSISFTIPSYLNAPCYYSTPACLMAAWQVAPGSYSVFVINANGLSSNALTFTVQ